jgi:hypothetical protein
MEDSWRSDVLLLTVSGITVVVAVTTGLLDLVLETIDGCQDSTGECARWWNQMYSEKRLIRVLT